MFGYDPAHSAPDPQSDNRTRAVWMCRNKTKTAEPLRARLFVNCCFGLAPKFFGVFGSIVHTAHAARWHWRSLFLFRNLRDQCFGGEQQARDGRGVLQRRARDVGWIGNAR